MARVRHALVPTCAQVSRIASTIKLSAVTVRSNARQSIVEYGLREGTRAVGNVSNADLDCILDLIDEHNKTTERGRGH